MKGPLVDKGRWPEGRSCEMDIPKWEEALKINSLHDQFKDVVQGLKNGFHQWIPEHGIKGLPFYKPKNHLSTLEAK
jgi:hypothetical protein